MDANELKKLRDDAVATLAKIEKSLADLTDAATPKRPFRRGEPVITWDDEKYKFMGFFVELRNGQWIVSGNSALLYQTAWTHCEHLPTFIDWELIDEMYGCVVEYDSGILSPWVRLPTIYAKNGLGTVVAVHKRPEEEK